MKKTIVLLLAFALSAALTYAADGDFNVGGNVRVWGNLALFGTGIDSRYGIYADKYFTDPSVAKGIFVHFYPTWTGAETTAEYCIGMDSTAAPIVNYGHVNSGYTYGMRNTVLRNANAEDSDDNGRLVDLSGMYITYGHYFKNASAVPVTTNAYGIRINPYYLKGTIDNMYDIYLGAPTTGGTATNRWGIYQANTAKNVFGGSIGIGTTNLGGSSAALALGDGARPTTLGAAGLFASGGALNAFDGLGHETPITPHSLDAPDWMYDAEDGLPIMVREIQYIVGFVRYTNQTRQARLVSMTDAEKSSLTPRQRTCIYKESFADHNARLGLTGEKALVRKDWDAEQLAAKNARDAERLAAMKARADRQAARAAAVAKDSKDGAELIEPEVSIQIPEEYVIREMPARLKAVLDASKQ